MKYYIRATGQWKDESGREIALHLVSNPSHLEAVDPVAVGRVRAKYSGGDLAVLGFLPQARMVAMDTGVNVCELELGSIV